VVGDITLSVSAWPFSLQDLEQAKHIDDLPTRDYITVNLDDKQIGVEVLIPGVEMSVHCNNTLADKPTISLCFLFVTLPKMKKLLCVQIHILMQKILFKERK
jgi:hypothetical protein